MKIKVDFTADKDGREDLKVLKEALQPICENYAQRPGKGDAVLAFAEELAKYARECASTSDDATHGACAAAAKSHEVAKAKLGKLVAAHKGENKRNPELERIRRIVKSGERLIRKENVARLRFEEKVKRLATIPVE